MVLVYIYMYVCMYVCINSKKLLFKIIFVLIFFQKLTCDVSYPCYLVKSNLRLTQIMMNYLEPY